MDQNRTNELILSEYAKRLIKFKARQLCQRRDFRSSELDDVQQDLWLALVKAARHFDPSKASLDTFASRVVNTAVAMILRRRQRRYHDNGVRIESLDAPTNLESETSEHLGELVSQADLSRRTGYEPSDQTVKKEQSEAIEHALKALPGSLRKLCRRLMGGCLAHVARVSGISRRQVRNAVAEARPFFEQSGIEF